MALGVVVTLSAWLPLVLAGLVVLTAGFFGAHAVASGWTLVAAPEARTQAAVYNLACYAGSSLFGWLGGVGFVLAGWPGTVGIVLALVAIAASLATAVLRDQRLDAHGSMQPKGCASAVEGASWTCNQMVASDFPSLWSTS